MKKGDIVLGRITGIKPYGAFVKIGDTQDGLIHISEISEKFVRNIADYVKIGDEVQLEVLGLTEDGKISLSFKRVKANDKRRYAEIRLESGFATLKELLPHWIENYGKNRIG